MLRLLVILPLILLGLLLFSGCQRQNPNHAIHLSGSTMGTTWSISLLPEKGETDLVGLEKQLQQRLDQINALMSTYDPVSEISRFNDQLGTEWFPVSTATAEVVALSLQISQLTGGAFDISVGPLVELWGFGPKERGRQIPTDEQIQALLGRIGYQNLQLRQHPPAMKKQIPLLRIDLSAVAKGYAVDALAGLLRDQGYRNFLVEIGGEMRIAGRREDGTPWRIAIEKPLEGRREVETIFPLTATAVATSGNYRNFFVENGQRYAHTIDPVTGRPARHKLASVTVLDLTCARADALATALMVMGEDQGRRFCEKNRIAAFFLIHEGEGTVTYASPAFQDFLHESEK